MNLVKANGDEIDPQASREHRLVGRNEIDPFDSSESHASFRGQQLLII